MSHKTGEKCQINFTNFYKLVDDIDKKEGNLACQEKRDVSTTVLPTCFWKNDLEEMNLNTLYYDKIYNNNKII